MDTLIIALFLSFKNAHIPKWEDVHSAQVAFIDSKTTMVFDSVIG